MKIQTIYNIVAEDAYKNTYQCTISGEIAIDKPTPIYLQKWDERNPLFSYTKSIGSSEDVVHDELITLHFEDTLNIEPLDPPSFKHLFWIEPDVNSSKYLFKFIECGSVTPLTRLDIAYNDSTKIALKTPISDVLQKNCTSNYVFEAGKYKLLFIKAWQNGAQNWHAYGIRSGKEKDVPRIADIALEENDNHEKVRILKKELYNKVYFPTHFDEIDILAYEEINFVDIGEAQAAHDALLDKEHNGDALVSLWEEYSKMELELANEECDELGKIDYKFYKKPQNGIAQLEVSANSDQSVMLRQLADRNAQFHLVCDKALPPIVTLVKYNNNLKIATVEDELYRLPSSGKLMLSVIGDEIVDKRRRQAIKQLFKGRRIVLQNLLFAIENEADKMYEDQHKHIPALSSKTKSFLFEKFGIKQLTKNQEEAVELALNNRNDITIIQGPPGTGKTTVVAAICQRLLELAEKNKDTNGSVKTILASAFQNDTIEHLASKIYTHGLPTIKVGRKTLGVPAEKVYINDLAKHLKDEITLRGGVKSSCISLQLSDLAYKFKAERNIDNAIEEIENILSQDTFIEGLDFERLNEIKRSIRKSNRTNERTLEFLEKIPTTIDSYNFDDGYSTLCELEANGFILTDSEANLIREAPEINPDKNFIDSLKLLKERLLIEDRKCHQATEEFHINEILNWINSAIAAALKFEETNFANEDEFITSVLSDLSKDLHLNSGYIRKSLQEYGETVAATNQLSGSNEMKGFQHIHNVILEEAARSNPLDLLIPMIKAENRIIMVGDQNQLPHLLETDVAERSLANIDDVDEKKEKRKLYSQSLFGIIFENVNKGKRQRCITLEEQFRMHPTICDFISNTYYLDTKTGKGMLKSGSNDLYESKKHGLTLPWVKDKTMIFCDVNSTHKEGKGKSKYRLAEAEKIMSIIDELKTDSEFNNLSIGIITFYSRQVSVLFEEAERHGYAIKSKDGYEIHPDYLTMEGDQEKLRIGTVDSFQGKEFDIVFLSTVRSNDIKREDGNEKKVFGFLTLKNRLNVAFSRAKKLVITVGDAKMFEDDYAKQYVQGLYEFCTNITKNKPYGGRI